MSERRACRVIGCCRMTMRYEVVRQDDLLHRIPLELVAVVARPHLGLHASKLRGKAFTNRVAPRASIARLSRLGMTVSLWPLLWSR